MVKSLFPKLNDFPLIDHKWIDARGHHTQNKWSLPIVKDRIAGDFIVEVNSKEFLNYLSKLTSIPDIAPPPIPP